MRCGLLPKGCHDVGHWDLWYVIVQSSSANFYFWTLHWNCVLRKNELNQIGSISSPANSVRHKDHHACSLPTLFSPINSHHNLVIKIEFSQIPTVQKKTLRKIFSMPQQFRLFKSRFSLHCWSRKLLVSRQKSSCQSPLMPASFDSFDFVPRCGSKINFLARATLTCFDFGWSFVLFWRYFLVFLNSYREKRAHNKLTKSWTVNSKIKSLCRCFQRTYVNLN